MAQNTWAISPGTMSSDFTIWTVTWSNVNNAKVSDNVFTTSNIGSNAIDSYPESNYDWVRDMYPYPFWIAWCWQSFTGIGTNIWNCQFYLKKVWNPTWTAYAKIYSHSLVYWSSSIPNTLLAISDPFDVSTLTTSIQLIAFIFSWANQIQLNNGTYYVVTFEYNWWDSSNKLQIWWDQSSPTHWWNSCLQTFPWGSWGSNSGIDLIFYVNTFVTSAYLKATNFWLSVPNWAKILWIKAEVEAKSSATTLFPYMLQIVKADWSFWTQNKATNISLSTTESYITYWWASDLWGETWTPTNVNDTDFWFVYSVSGSWTWSVDHIRLTVYYDNVVNPTNAYASDDTYAQLTWAISWDLWVSISKDWGLNYSSVLTKTFTSSETYETYGTGSTELWGISLNWDDIDDTSFRLKIEHNWVSQIYKNFGFAIWAGTIITGLEVWIEAKYIVWDTSIYVDNIHIKAYYGTSTLPIQEGSQAYASNWRKPWEWAGAGTGVLVFYDSTWNWKSCIDWNTITA